MSVYHLYKMTKNFIVVLMLHDSLCAILSTDFVHEKQNWQLSFRLSSCIISSVRRVVNSIWGAVYHRIRSALSLRRSARVPCKLHILFVWAHIRGTYSVCSTHMPGLGGA